MKGIVNEKRKKTSIKYRKLKSYGDRSVYSLNVALLDEDLNGLEAERLDLRLLQRLASLQLLDLPVQIRHRRRPLPPRRISPSAALPLSLEPSTVRPTNLLAPVSETYVVI